MKASSVENSPRSPNEHAHTHVKLPPLAVRLLRALAISYHGRPSTQHRGEPPAGPCAGHNSSWVSQRPPTPWQILFSLGDHVHWVLVPGSTMLKTCSSARVM